MPSPSSSPKLRTPCPIFVERNAEWQLGRVSESKLNLEAEIANTEKDLAQTQEALNNVTDDTERTRLETSLAQYRSTYSTLVASYQQVRIAESQAINNIVVAEPAVSPETPIRPRTRTIRCWPPSWACCWPWAWRSWSNTWTTPSRPPTM